MISLYTKIEVRLASISDADLIRLISNEVDGFRARFQLKTLGRSELIKILSLIENYCDFDIINLKIAIRLAGGIFECSKKLSYEDPLFLSNLLSVDNGCEKLITEFISKLNFSREFFDKPRTFYSDRDITLTRQRNINNILATSLPVDTERFIEHFETEKRMHEVHFLTSATQFATADYIARKVEVFFNLPLGQLDQVSAK